MAKNIFLQFHSIDFVRPALIFRRTFINKFWGINWKKKKGDDDGDFFLCWSESFSQVLAISQRWIEYKRFTIQGGSWKRVLLFLFLLCLFVLLWWIVHILLILWFKFHILWSNLFYVKNKMYIEPNIQFLLIDEF